MFGKWGLGLKGTAGAPQKKGWDHFMGHLHHVEAHYQQPDSMWRLENDNLIPFATPEGSYGNELFTREAVKFLNSQSGEEPFFMYRSEEHTSELQSLMRISYAVICLNKKRGNNIILTFN